MAVQYGSGVPAAQVQASGGVQYSTGTGVPKSSAGGANPYSPNQSQYYTYNATHPSPTTQGGTLNANISVPKPTIAKPPPAVVTSQNAQTDLNNKQTQVDQLNQDTAQHQQALATPPAQTQSNAQTDQSQPASDNSSGSLQDEINSLIGNLGTQQDSINQQEQADLTPIQQQQQQVQTALDQAASQALTKLNQIASGTYPLSSSERSLLSSTTDLYNQTIQAQQNANQAYTGQMTELMASLGINTSAPTEAIGMVNSAIDSGNSKVATLNAQMAQSLAQLTQGFQTQDYTMVQNAWNATSTYMTNRVNTLQSMQKSVQDAAEQQKQDMKDQTTTALSAIMDSNTINYQDKQLALSQANLDETTRHDMVTEMNSRYEYSDGMVFDKQTGQAAPADPTVGGAVSSTPGQTGIPLLDQNTQTTSSGISYIDGTNLTGSQLTTAQNYAANLGIPFIGAKQAAAVDKIEAARENLANIDQVLQGGGENGGSISPSNALTRAIYTPDYAAEGFTQSGPEASAIAAYNTFRSAAIEALQAVAGGTGSGLRINQAEIQMSIDNDIPKLTDTAAVRDQKLANMKSLLDSNEQQLFGSKVWNAANPDSQNAIQSNALDSILGGGGDSLSSGTDSTLDSLANQNGL